MKQDLSIALVSDTYPPHRTSGAIQMRDLAEAFASAGHRVTVITADPEVGKAGKIEHHGEVTVVRLFAPPTKGVSRPRRLVSEALQPYSMWLGWRLSGLAPMRFDGVVFYSPSIFLSPFVKRLTRPGRTPCYLILRDMFPDWAVDLGLLKRGPVLRWLHRVARQQFAVADRIGVQSQANLARSAEQPGLREKAEVLQNWLQPMPPGPCSIDLAQTALAGRKVFIYTGNVGLAQGLDVILDLADALRHHSHIGFLIVGRGDDFARLAQAADDRKLDNLLFMGEIPPDEIAGLCAQAVAGLIMLDPRHTTHNVPGKLLAYLSAGLPVFGAVNPGNDVIELVASAGVGWLGCNRDPGVLATAALALLDQIEQDQQVAGRCRALAQQQFSPVRAASQIVEALDHA